MFNVDRPFRLDFREGFLVAGVGFVFFAGGWAGGPRVAFLFVEAAEEEEVRRDDEDGSLEYGLVRYHGAKKSTYSSSAEPSSSSPPRGFRSSSSSSSSSSSGSGSGSARLTTY